MREMASVRLGREIPVRHDVDVFIARGGPAGVAAALAARGDASVHDVNVRELQGRLKEMGAYLPNARQGCGKV